MNRYFVELVYNGGPFNGWQIQPNAISVQETLEKAFSLILREKISISGCGRTDTGVHAKSYVAHFDCSLDTIDSDYYCYKFNTYLPKAIALRKISKVDKNAHARFDALERSYEYHITTRKNPFKEGLSTHIYYKPNVDAMNEAAKLLLQYNDFTSFAKLHSDAKTNDCNVTRAEWSQVSGDQWVFHISANRFLRNMVRAIVGTLLEVGKGNLNVVEFSQIIEAKDRNKAGTSVPPQGLFLTDIKYPFTF